MPEASYFFIFLNQITSGFEHLFSSLTGLARNPILAILGTLSCYISSQTSWGSRVQRDERKLLLSLCVWHHSYIRVLLAMWLPCPLWSTGARCGVGGHEEHRNASYNTSFARGSVCHWLDSETAGNNLHLCAANGAWAAPKLHVCGGDHRFPGLTCSCCPGVFPALRTL